MLDFNLAAKIGYQLNDGTFITIYDSSDYNEQLSANEIMIQHDLERTELLRLLISTQKLSSYIENLIADLKAIAIDKINSGEVIGNKQVGLYEFKIVEKVNINYKESETYIEADKQFKEIKELVTFASKKGQSILNEKTGEYIQPCSLSNNNYIMIKEVKK